MQNKETAAGDVEIFQHPMTVTREELLEDSNDANFRQMVHDLLAYTARVESVRNGFGKLIGLTGVEYSMLIAILHLSEKGPVYVNTVADHLHLSGAFVTLQTNSLAKKGLINKIKDSKDARRVHLEDTDKARSLLEQLAPTQSQVNDILFNALTRDDFKQFAGIMSRMVTDGDKAVALLDYLSKGFSHSNA